MSRGALRAAVAAAVCVAAGFSWLALRGRGVGGPAARPEGQEVGWEAPALSRPDQDGRQVTSAALRGHVWIADFIFTRCTSACPILSARLVSLQRRLPDPSLRFISFSVDPEHDTPAALKEYAARWHGDEARWRLLANDAASLREIAAGMKVPVQATGDEKDPILHTNRFLLVDQRGVVRGRYDSTDEGELQQLLGDTRALLAGAALAGGAAQVLARDAPDGARLLGELGCLGCHATPQVAPPLAGLSGRRVELAGGQAVSADAAYLRESIVSPAAKVVAGYAPTMPGYAWLEPAQVEALVAHLTTLSGGPAPQARTQETDPVCKMTVSAGEDTPYAAWRGRTYWFCADGCRRAFVQDPERFLRAAR